MTKCAICKRKLNLATATIGKCKCKGPSGKDQHFCRKHRLPSEHKCTFDFKTTAREQLKKQNPVVEAEKLVRI